MIAGASAAEFRLMRLPRIIIASTAVLLAIGIACSLAWAGTGDVRWIRIFFSLPGALFFVGCSVLQLWLSLLCWQQFSPGDLLRPAWLLIALSALAQLAGGLLAQVLGTESPGNPLRLLIGERAGAIIFELRDYGELFGPVYMALLAWGLGYVLYACRQNGVLGRLKTPDAVLLAIAVFYTIDFFATVLSPGYAPQPGIRTFIRWASDPLLCVLLLEALLIRRSTANLGWGLVSRCWLCFTAAIFLTSVGDISLWAWSKGWLPQALIVASWFLWFLPAAAYALGPAYQLIAILRATRGEIRHVMAA